MVGTITGSSGFVGKNINEYFKNNTNWEIDTFDRNAFNSRIKFATNTYFVINLIGKAHDIKRVSCPDEYYKTNTDLCNHIYDAFVTSNAKVFITLSSIKAVADEVDSELSEDTTPNPITHYGKSKLLAEQYILSKPIPLGKKVFILRPCMIHGPSNKGNLNLLYSLVSKGLPWPLGKFENSRSYLSIENLCFIVKELIDSENIPSGVYNVSDDVPLSTNEVIQLIAQSKGKETRILKLSKHLITSFARIGDFLKLPLNSERLQKLTESYMVSNSKIKLALGKQLPVSSKEGLMRTFQSFAKNV